jgi:hypothetical protein
MQEQGQRNCTLIHPRICATIGEGRHLSEMSWTGYDSRTSARLPGGLPDEQSVSELCSFGRGYLGSRFL